MAEIILLFSATEDISSSLFVLIGLGCCGFSELNKLIKNDTVSRDLQIGYLQRNLLRSAPTMTPCGVYLHQPLHLLSVQLVEHYAGSITHP